MPAWHHVPADGRSHTRGCRPRTGPLAGDGAGMPLGGHRAALTHTQGDGSGVISMRGGGRRSRWIFTAVSCVGTSQGQTDVRCTSPPGVRQARKKDVVPQNAGKRMGPGDGMKRRLLPEALAMPPGLVAASSKPRAVGQTPTHLVRGSGVTGHLEFITEHAASPGRVPAMATHPCFTAGRGPEWTTQAMYRPPQEV